MVSLPLLQRSRSARRIVTVLRDETGSVFFFFNRLKEKQVERNSANMLEHCDAHVEIAKQCTLKNVSVFPIFRKRLRLCPEKCVRLYFQIPFRLHVRHARAFVLSRVTVFDEVATCVCP